MIISVIISAPALRRLYLLTHGLHSDDPGRDSRSRAQHSSPRQFTASTRATPANVSRLKIRATAAGVLLPHGGDRRGFRAAHSDLLRDRTRRGFRAANVDQHRWWPGQFRGHAVLQSGNQGSTFGRRLCRSFRANSEIRDAFIEVRPASTRAGRIIMSLRGPRPWTAVIGVGNRTLSPRRCYLCRLRNVSRNASRDAEITELPRATRIDLLRRTRRARPSSGVQSGVVRPPFRQGMAIRHRAREHGRVGPASTTPAARVLDRLHHPAQHRSGHLEATWRCYAAPDCAWLHRSTDANRSQQAPRA